MDRSKNNVDSDFHEEVQRQVAKVITIEAQVNYGSPARVELISGTAFQGATGYLVAQVDNNTSQISLGDNIVSVNGQSVQFRIGEVVPQAFYTHQPTLLYLPFFSGTP